MAVVDTKMGVSATNSWMRNLKTPLAQFGSRGLDRFVTQREHFRDVWLMFFWCDSSSSQGEYLSADLLGWCALLFVGGGGRTGQKRPSFHRISSSTPNWFLESCTSIGPKIDQLMTCWKHVTPMAARNPRKSEVKGIYYHLESIHLQGFLWCLRPHFLFCWIFGWTWSKQMR